MSDFKIKVGDEAVWARWDGLEWQVKILSIAASPSYIATVKFIRCLNDSNIQAQEHWIESVPVSNLKKLIR